jgi:hypothetical protein
LEKALSIENLTTRLVLLAFKITSCDLKRAALLDRRFILANQKVGFRFARIKRLRGDRADGSFPLFAYAMWKSF